MLLQKEVTEKELKKLQAIAVTMKHAGDRVHADKVEQLVDKLESGLMYAAFCGHFSAGKSSLINKVCGHQLLPSSPIPTSANIVSIRSGVAGATITRTSEAGQERKEERIRLEDLGEHCRNGADIERVEISYPISWLGEHAALLDTPGIDSTDDAHQMSTESALHLADVVFYVMDYNHVQSEINFAFTKKMKDWGKPLYLIVNMIDKHRETELSFEQYKASAIQAFKNWHIEPDGVLFTSVKSPQFPGNQYEELLVLLQQLIAKKSELTAWSLAKSTTHLIEQHRGFVAEQNEPQKAELREQAESEGAAQLREQHAALEAELAELKALPEKLRLQARKDVTAIVDNANIIPANVRDMAHEYLQSRKPGFKAGFLASAAKTAQEVERRLSVFHKAYEEGVEAQIAWHIRESLKKLAEAQGLRPDAYSGIVEGVKIAVTPQSLAGQVNTGAVFGNEYTMTYSKDVAAESRAAYRRDAFEAIDALLALLAPAQAERTAALEAQAAELAGRLAASRELQRLEGEEAAYIGGLLAQAPATPQAPALPRPRAAAASAAGAAPAAAAEPPQLARLALDAAGEARGGASASAGGGARDSRRRLEATAERLTSAAEVLAGVPALRTAAKSMREKADRLASNNFTIALFGAFSAGKSSFANALLGERVLPVSPNPTTAAINRILPPTAEWPHRSVKIRFKTADAILSDVRYSLGALGQEPSATAEMADCLAAISKLQPGKVSGKGKPHFTFLKAVEQGWSGAADKLGTEERAGMEQFSAYVAEESKSCFVEWIELYYSNALTDQGIILVDTPGADSINARHTGVAFNYIKNADAILFVTYYNHAFSQADREFLLQLGRVKDSFELDKMFFIVNAADLAADRDELDGVVEHVKTNLIGHGIRNPRIFPVSSLAALEAKLANNTEAASQSGIASFEQQFISFTFEELTGIALHSAQGELTRAVSSMEHFIKNAQSGEEERKLKLQELLLGQSRALSQLNSLDSSVDEKAVAGEVQELIYYVRQRSMFRFGEFYNLAFNPSTFREESGDLKQTLLNAWKELQQRIAFDLSQEALASTLRIEKFINKTASKRYSDRNEEMISIIPSVDAVPYPTEPFSTPEVPVQLHSEEISGRWLLGLFKNPKHFFEGDGKTKLKAELEGIVGPMVEQALEKVSQQLGQHYREVYKAWNSELIGRQESQLQEHVSGLQEALEMKIDIGEYIAKKGQLEQLLT